MNLTPEEQHIVDRAMRLWRQDMEFLELTNRLNRLMGSTGVSRKTFILDPPIEVVIDVSKTETLLRSGRTWFGRPAQEYWLRRVSREQPTTTNKNPDGTNAGAPVKGGHEGTESRGTGRTEQRGNRGTEGQRERGHGETEGRDDRDAGLPL